MAKAKSTLSQLGIKGLEEAAAGAGGEEYVDRRAIPSDRSPLDYVIEDDPILAIGDTRVHPSTPTQVAQVVDRALDEVQNAEIPVDQAQGEGPRIEIASDADPIARLAAAMEKMVERQQGPSPIDPTLAALLSAMMATMERIVQAQVAGNASNAEALRKSQDPSNPFAPGTSVFNPRGERDHPRPQLKCKMFLPWEAEVESLTREEIELLNLLQPGEFYIRRNDESRIMMEIKATINPNSGKFDRLLMNSETALSNDYHWLMPPMRNYLRQILNQRADTKSIASRVMTMEQELELIQEYGVDFEKVLAIKAQQQEVQ